MNSIKIILYDESLHIMFRMWDLAYERYMSPCNSSLHILLQLDTVTEPQKDPNWVPPLQVL
jgi:hypothetical protein